MRNLTLRKFVIVIGIFLVLTGSNIFKEPANDLKQIGVQLFSARSLMQDVPVGLAFLADCGYTTLETYGYNNGTIFGYSPQELVLEASKHGLTITSSHANLRVDIQKDNMEEILAKWDKLIDDHAVMGCNYIVIANFRYGEGPDAISEACKYFNIVADKVSSKGMKLCYHNSIFETGEIEGEVILDYLIANTDPEKFFFELDLLHSVEGDLDPVLYLKKYPDRIILLHVSDKDVAGASGTIDMKSIFNQFYENGHYDYYIEVEHFGDYSPEEALKLSADFALNSPYIK